MKKLLHKLLIPVAFAVFAFAAFTQTPPANAAAAGSDAAVQFVQKLGDKALSSLTDKELAPADREKKVRELLRGYFDVQAIGKFALGTHYRTATEAQRSEYMTLFEDMIVKTYAQRFSEYSGQTFQVGKAVKREEGSKNTIVASKILQTDGPPVNVEWVVRNKDGQMKIIDVIVESISMSVTQRSDFAAVIQRGGGKVESLLQSMRERAGQAAE
jgi:phospholipid transport system substrate-binding protein